MEEEFNGTELFRFAANKIRITMINANIRNGYGKRRRRSIQFFACLALGMQTNCLRDKIK